MKRSFRGAEDMSTATTTAAGTLGRPRYDRSIVDGPLAEAVWRLAWPTILQNVFAGLQGLVDHVMVGHFVGFAGNAAIGVSWQIFLVVVVFASSLFTGMAVLVARYAGAGEPDRVDRTVYQAFLTAVVLATGILAPLGYAAAPRLLGLVHAAPAVQAEALPYLRTMFVWSVGMLLFYMLGGALRAAGDAKTPMRLGIAMTILNIVLNVVLIRGLGPIPAFGTRGAALGSVLAAGLVSAWGLYLLFRGRLVVHLRRELGLRPDPGVIAALFRFGLPAGFQGIAMNLGGVFLLRYIGSLETSAEAQAAYTVGYTQLFSLITWTSIALMAATSTIAGQNLGAQRPERTAATPRAAIAVGLWVAAPVALLFFAAPAALLRAFGITEPTVIALGSQLLGFLAVSGFFLLTAIVFTGALQGTGDTRSPLFITLISQLALPLGLCAAIDAVGTLQAPHIWTAILLGHVTRCVLSVARFRQGRWRSIRVE